MSCIRSLIAIIASEFSLARPRRDWRRAAAEEAVDGERAQGPQGAPETSDAAGVWQDVLLSDV